MKKKISALLIVSLIALMAATAAWADTETIAVFTITPTSAPIGTDVEFAGTYDTEPGGFAQTAFCFYFATADEPAWDTNFTALGSDAGVTFVKNASANYCPAQAGYGRFGFYTTDTSAAVFGDSFRQTVTVPSVATGTKIIAVRQYGGADCEDEGDNGGGDAPGGATCAYVNFRSVTNFVVQPAPATVYAGAAGCAGNSPCYTSLAAAYNAVAAGGTIRVVASMPAENLAIAKDLTLLDYNGSGALSGNVGVGVLQIASGAVVVQDLTITANLADDVFNVSGGDVVVKGCTLSGGGNTFDGAAGTLAAYANNIGGYTTGTAFAGTFNGRHNWWGAGATEVGIGDADAYAYRLGADVAAWGEGSLGGASITADTATGTGVIVSHGRGDANAPFGQATTADGNTQCSDYFDVFTAPGATAGNWLVTIPVDAGNGCDYTYNNRQLFRFDLTAGAPTPACTALPVDPLCWDDLKDTAAETLVQMGRTVGVRWQTASTAELGGTPIIAGNQDGNDPTAVTMQSVSARSQTAWLPWVILAAALLMAAGALMLLRKRLWDQR
ncbi:MAG: hypothetical protein L0Z70_14305 [Chloroflexi bacterium]|nr:hypothetical protein [Chloroflexota bacterium]